MPNGLRFDRNLVQKLERTHGVLDALDNGAKAAAEKARDIARAEAYDTGAYHDSIKGHRVGAEVVLEATDFKAKWIEKGTVRQSPKAPLKRGARMAGLRLHVFE